MRNTIINNKYFYAALVLLFLTGAAALFSFRMLPQEELEETGTYRYHFTLITGNGQEDAFWQAVLNGARQEAEKNDAYVELLGRELHESLRVLDLLHFARYIRTDGVLVYPENSLLIEHAIQKLEAQGTPVITLQKDSEESGRTGFVGVNEYFLGQHFGKELRRFYPPEDNRKVNAVILYPGESYSETNRNWFRQGLENIIPENDYDLKSFYVYTVDGLTNLDKLLTTILSGDEAMMPEVFLCLNEKITEQTGQILTDRGLQDRIHVIGSSLSPLIREEITNGTVLSTITPDGEDMGRRAVRELLRYHAYGAANYAVSVDFKTIDRNSLRDIPEGDADEEN